MATHWHDDDGQIYTLPDNDPLGILASTRRIVELGDSAWINIDQVDGLCRQWLQEDARGQSEAASLWDNKYHFYDGTERSVNWLLLLDALNFCFWGEKDQPRWTIDYHGKTLNGYWAEAAALKRAVEEDALPLWDANYLSTITEETVAQIFRGSGTIPLFKQRVLHAREVGSVLLTRYGGQFINAIEQAGSNAVQLALLLVDDFPSFRDVAIYRSHQVNFFKRAQICVADLHGAFAGKAWGALSDLDQLTIFADYKLPQVLRHYNVLEYSPALALAVDHQEILEAGCEEEVEIRACTIWACELLRRSMLYYGRYLTAADIDQRLWLTGQHSEDMQPYHRTRTIYY
ncbi:MAG: hypothetical protein NVS2B12_00100 [Ktedonobacteraceae bacterium]